MGETISFTFSRFLLLQLVIYYISHNLPQQLPEEMSELVQVVCWVLRQEKRVGKKWNTKQPNLKLRASCGFFAFWSVSCSLLSEFPLLRWISSTESGGRIERQWLIKVTTVPWGWPYQTAACLKVYKQQSWEGQLRTIYSRSLLSSLVIQTRKDGGRERWGKVADLEWRWKGWSRFMSVWYLHYRLPFLSWQTKELKYTLQDIMHNIW